MSETNSSRPATGAPLQLIGGSRWYGRLQLSPCITFNRPKAGPLNRSGSTKTLWLTSAFWSTFCKSGIVIRCDASDRRGINDDDVWIGNGGSRIFIEYRSRDATQDARNDDIRKDLNRSLADWESLVDVSFVRVRP
jgi:hypothetical protein